MKNKYFIITDPDKPCKSEYKINGRSAPDAIRKAILKGHDWLIPENIEKIEKVSDRGDITHVVTVKRLPKDPPSFLHSIFSIEGVYFWVSCIVKKIKKEKI